MVLARLPSRAKVSLFLPDGCLAPYLPPCPELGVTVAPSGNVFSPPPHPSYCSGAHGSCPQPQLGPIQLKERRRYYDERYMAGWRQKQMLPRVRPRSGRMPARRRVVQVLCQGCRCAHLSVFIFPTLPIFEWRKDTEVIPSYGSAKSDASGSA